MSLDVKNLLIQDWMTTTVAVCNSTVAKAQIDSGQGYEYFLADSAYDSQQVYREKKVLIIRMPKRGTSFAAS